MSGPVQGLTLNPKGSGSRNTPLVLQLFYLKERICKVVLQKSIPAQIRQLTLYKQRIS